MSTIMYNYKISKDSWWYFYGRLREHYLNDSMILELAKDYQKDKSFWKFCKDDENHVSIQLFDFGYDWIFRVLEHGYYFLDNHNKLFPELEEVFYDDRSDVLPDHKGNEVIARKIDYMIGQRQYLVAHIVDFDLLFSIAFDVDKIKENMANDR